MMEGKETIVRYQPDSQFPIVTHGLPFEQACAKHIGPTLNCSRTFVIASGTLSHKTDALERLEASLGDSVVGIRRGMQPHTLLTEVLEIATQVEDARADSLITLGGGTLVDAAKIIAFAIVKGIKTLETLLSQMKKSLEFEAKPPPWQPNYESTPIKIVCVTTTLSGGEFNLPIAGGVDPATLHKQLVYDHTAPGPFLIVWDPELTITTPLRTWVSTGIRAIDHCVEAFTAGHNVNANAKDCAIRGIRLIIPSLLQTINSPNDLLARLDAQMGCMLSVKGSFVYNGSAGASHGIGHQLGPFGVAHGVTSAILMPAVAEFNKSVVQPQQEELLKEAFWSEPTITELLEKKGLNMDTAELSQVMDTIIRALGLPRRLDEVGIGRDKFQQIAESSVKDRCCKKNPIPLTDPAMVVKILESIDVN